MCDYCATAFWSKGGGNLEYDQVPVSSSLIKELEEWTKKMDKLFWVWDCTDDENLKVPSDQMKEVCEEGLKLAQKVKNECPDWTVVYIDELKLQNDNFNNREDFETEIK